MFLKSPHHAEVNIFISYVPHSSLLAMIYIFLFVVFIKLITYK